MTGDTSQAYAGVTWGYKLPKRMFFNFSWGLAYHDGDKIHSATNVQTDKKELGSSFESLDRGVCSGKTDNQLL